MIEEVFEILKKEKLDSDERIERAIMRDRSVHQILAVVSRLSEAVGQHAGSAQTDLAGFDFLPNGEISAQYGSCIEWTCRVQRAERLARFAALWADRILIPSYFGRYVEDSRVAEDKALRYWVAGDLKVLLSLAPLLRAGIIELFGPGFHLCADCGRRYQDELAAAQERLARARSKVSDLYLDKVEVWFRSRAGRPHGSAFELGIRGPEDIVPHGVGLWIAYGPPEWLPRRLKRRAYDEDVFYRVPSSKIPSTGLLAVVLESVTWDVVMQHILSMFRGTKYLTNRQADAAFLCAVNDRDDYAAWSDVLSQYLQYDMPIIEGVPLEELVAVRRSEHDAFLVYRDTLKDIIRNHVAEHPALSGREAQQMYEDVVQPSLNRMKAKASSIRRSLVEKTGRDVVITGGLVGVGVFSGLLPADLAPLVGAVGGFSIAKDVLASLASLRSTPGELRNENLYFLWKIGEKRQKRPQA
jgi:hypothetical protein